MRLSLLRASSLNENVDHSALLKLGTSVGAREPLTPSPRPPRSPRRRHTRRPAAGDAEAVRTERPAGPRAATREAAARRLLRQERAGRRTGSWTS